MLPTPDALSAELTFLGFPADLSVLLLSATQEISRCPELLANFEITEQALTTGEPLPEPAHRFTALLVALGMLPAARARHRELGIAEEITRDTFSDLLRLSEGSGERSGEWAFTSLGWLKWHLKSELFQLGRLQYQLSTFPFPYRIYRHREQGSFVALAVAGLSIDAEGLPFTEAAKGGGSFVTTLEEGGDSITGYPADLSGAGKLSSAPVSLSLLDYELFLQQHDPAIAIHIAKGQRLDPEACDASLQEAIEFFPKVFPDFQWRAFRCVSWLLDPMLDQVVKPGANLALFGRRFYRVMPQNPNGNQVIERVFGPEVDPLAVVPQNSLQARINECLKAGGKFYTTGGFLPR